MGLPDATMLGAFFLVTLGILIVPGPDVLYVMARSLGQGRRAGLLSVLGVGAGVLVHTMLAAIGLSQLFQHVPAAYNLVRFAGVAYLLYLAYRILRDRGEDVTSGVPRQDRARKLVGQAFLTNILNPKAALFFVALLPQFTSASGGDALFREMLWLGLLVVAMSMAVNALYAILAARVSVALRGNRRAERVQRWASASVLGIIAVLAVRATLPADS